MLIKLKRAYEPPQPEDGFRILVDRLWPRGLSKAAACIDLWLKDVAPSTSLRKWFDHDPSKWSTFRTRYFRELDERTGVLDELLEHARNGPVTLIYAAKDEEHNHAVALNEYLKRHLKQ